MGQATAQSRVVGGGSPAPFTEADGDAFWLRLDAANDPMTDDLDMGNNDLLNVTTINSATEAFRKIFTNIIQCTNSNNINMLDRAGVNLVQLQPSNVIFNTAGVDVNVRVAGDGDPNLMTWDGGLDRVGIGRGLTAAGAKLDINQTANERALCVESAATTTTVVNVIANAVTSGFILDCDDADSLTTGFMQRFISDSAATDTRTLIQYTNDNVLATGATVLGIQQDAAQRAAFIDQNGLAEAVAIDMHANDAGFVNYIGTAAANATSPISTFTTAGALAGFVQQEINGASQWFAFYDDPTA